MSYIQLLYSSFYSKRYEESKDKILKNKCQVELLSEGIGTLHFSNHKKHIILEKVVTTMLDIDHPSWIDQKMYESNVSKFIYFELNDNSFYAIM